MQNIVLNVSLKYTITMPADTALLSLLLTLTSLHSTYKLVLFLAWKMLYWNFATGVKFLWDNRFSAYAKFSGKLLFLIIGLEIFVFQKILRVLSNWMVLSCVDCENVLPIKTTIFHAEKFLINMYKNKNWRVTNKNYLPFFKCANIYIYI